MMQKNLDAKVEAILVKLDTSSNGAAELPRALELPLETMADVDRLEEAIHDSAKTKALVGNLSVNRIIESLISLYCRDATPVKIKNRKISAINGMTARGLPLLVPAMSKTTWRPIPTNSTLQHQISDSFLPNIAKDPQQPYD